MKYFTLDKNDHFIGQNESFISLSAKFDVLWLLQAMPSITRAKQKKKKNITTLHTSQQKKFY